MYYTLWCVKTASAKMCNTEKKSEEREQIITWKNIFLPELLL